MKRNQLLILFLAFLSLVSGYLLSGISWVGRTGVNLIYKEYKFLKVWWKGALAIFVVWMLLMLVQSLFGKSGNRFSSRLLNVIALLAAIAGLGYCYYDFNNTLSHRLLGQKFHFGVYLFWVGWIIISLFFLSRRKDAITSIEAGQRTI